MSTDNLQATDAVSTLSAQELRAALTERLSKPFRGTLETLAQESGLSLKDVVDCLPQASRSHIAGERFIEIMEEVGSWGEVLLILNTENGVFECKGAIVPGSVGMGYYNLGHGSPISGHLRHDRCRDIYCVRRSFHNLDTCSIQFFNEEGASMFKLFVSRQEDRQLKPEQVQSFERLSGLTQAS